MAGPERATLSQAGVVSSGQPFSGVELRIATARVIEARQLNCSNWTGCPGSNEVRPRNASPTGGSPCGSTPATQDLKFDDAI